MLVRTERLTLRTYVEADRDALYETYSRPDVARYLRQHPLTADALDDVLTKRIQSTELTREGHELWLAIVPDAPEGPGTVAGDVLLRYASEQHSRAELGYVLHPEQRGHGYAREAAAAMLAIAFDTYGFERVVARCDAQNLASARVMEHLGMRREAHLVRAEHVKGRWVDLYDYALLRSEWAGR